MSNLLGDGAVPLLGGLSRRSEQFTDLAPGDPGSSCRGDCVGDLAGWNLTTTGTATSDSFIRLFPLEEVLEETEALLDGSSHVTLDRVRRMEDIHGVLSI